MKKPISDEPEVSGETVANLFEVDPSTVRTWRRRDGMPCVIYGRKMIRYRLSEVRAWLKTRPDGREKILSPTERAKTAAAK